MTAPIVAEFDDIHLLNLDESRTHNPDPTRGLYDVYLTLSRYPPVEWSQFFDQERQFPRHSMWRRAWVTGNHFIRTRTP